jgi:acylphosphatase
MRCRYRVKLSGDVQGVGLRWQLRNYAQANNLAGWVKNMADGTVVAEIEGEADKVTAAIIWLTSQIRFARVSKWQSEAKAIENESCFNILG